MGTQIQSYGKRQKEISNFLLNGHRFEYNRGDESILPLIPKSVNRGNLM